MTFRTQKPQPRGKITFTLPEIQKFTLDNGLNVLFVQKDRLPIIQLTLVTDAGSRLDPNEKKGLSNITSSLLDEGAGGLDSLQLNDAIESLGSVLSIFSDPDSMFITMLTITENFEQTLNLLSKVVLKPHLDEVDFQREKRKILTRIIQAKDDASYVASSVFEKLIYGIDSPYGLPEIGTMETVGRIELNDIRFFYETLLTPGNSTLIAVGDISRSALENKLNAAFTGWHTYDPPVISIDNPIRQKTRVFFIHKEDAAQSEIRIGHSSQGRNTPDFFPRMIMNMILGGQFSSRINLNLREDKGFTYGASSAFNFNKCNGYFLVSAPVKSENTAESIWEIIKEMKGILVYITDKELRFAKSALVRKYPSLFETYGQIGRSLANKVINSLPDDYFNTYINNIKQVTLEEVYEAARTNIFPEELIILVVGNRELVLPQLESLGCGSITELDIEGNEIAAT